MPHVVKTRSADLVHAEPPARFTHLHLPKFHRHPTLHSGRVPLITMPTLVVRQANRAVYFRTTGVTASHLPPGSSEQFKVRSRPCQIQSAAYHHVDLPRSLATSGQYAPIGTGLGVFIGTYPFVRETPSPGTLTPAGQ